TEGADTPAAYGPGGCRARPAREPRRALVADPGLPAAAVEGAGCGGGVRGRRPGPDRPRVLGRLRPCPAVAGHAGGDARCRAGAELPGPGLRLPARPHAHHPARPRLPRRPGPGRPRPRRLRRDLRHPPVPRRRPASRQDIHRPRLPTDVTTASAAILLFLILEDRKSVV